MVQFNIILDFSQAVALDTTISVVRDHKLTKKRKSFYNLRRHLISENKQDVYFYVLMISRLQRKRKGSDGEKTGAKWIDPSHHD